MNKNTPKDVLYHFREESRQHFEFIYDTMQEKERFVIHDILQGKPCDPDNHEIELLERNGYVVRKDDDTFCLFCSEFERFVTQYRL